MLITFSKLLIHAATAIDEAYQEGRENELENIELSSDQILETMDIDNITICYETTGIANFDIKKTEQILKQNYTKNEFDIHDVIVRKNCAYLKVRHDIPLQGRNKCYGACFSINYMEPNNGVAVYGYSTKNAAERQVFKEIANELIKSLL
ncbi:hypothetical protein [Flavobacterium gelatinilyticum]|uniref:hypothetical protein n=1 Tax=Flavobacterium gelatinilyticum TaxID=3003260 RepID=UPI00248084F7|nr:hypothetical protein [Flavobacterium gelatinilyticum]